MKRQNNLQKIDNKLDKIKDIFFIILIFILLIFIIVQIINIFKYDQSKIDNEVETQEKYNFPDTMTDEERKKQEIYDEYLNYIMQNQE